MRVISLDNDRLNKIKLSIFTKSIEKAFQKKIAPNFNGALYTEMMGGSFESIKESVNSIPNPTDVQIVIKSLVDSLDNRVDDLAAKKGYKVALFSTEADESNDETKDDADAEKDFEKDLSDDGVDTEGFDSTTNASDALGDTIEEMISNLAEKAATDIRQTIKSIIKLEKINQDKILEEKRNEEGEFSNNFDDDKTEGGDNEDDDNTEGDDPFGGDSDDNGGDDPFSAGDDSGEGESDPFGTDEKDPFSSEENDEKDGEIDESSNPFEGDGENSGENNNPFDENGDSENSDNEGSAAFESHEDYGFIKTKILGSTSKNNLSRQLSIGSFRNFAKYHADILMKDRLEKSYASESMEEFNKKKAEYKRLNKVLFNTAVETISVANSLGFKYDVSKIAYPDLESIID